MTTGIRSVFLMSLLAVGCASDRGLVGLQPVEVPVTSMDVLRDEATRPGVLVALEEWLNENDLEYSVVESRQETTPDGFVLEYEAHWSWDLATYMRLADITLTKGEETIGSASFDALEYGAFGKFGDAHARLKVIMDALFGKTTEDEANVLLGEL